MSTYPYSKFRYKVEIDGIEAGGFSEVSGFDASIDVIEYREGDMVQTPMKLQGLQKYGNITLKKGVIDNNVLFEWVHAGMDAEVERKVIVITLIDASGNDVASWQVINAWPTKYTAPDFNATASEVAVETIEIAHEGMVRTV